MKFAVFQNPVVFDTLNKLFAAQLPVKIAYRLSKVQKAISTESQKYQELRVGLIKKYGEKNEDGSSVVDENGNVKLLEGSMDELVEEMNELHDIDVEIPGHVTIDEIEKIDLSSYDLSILEELGVLKDE
jgi:hypothetical protein